MQRIFLLACLSIVLQACAKTSTTPPSFLGLPVVSENEISDESVNNPQDSHPALRHVASNKVLGAMAFQKTTGRSIDPERLQGSR